jgi:hypothetical protein
MGHLSPEEREHLRDAVRLGAVALREAGIPYALCGGYAAFARGGPEPNHDVDFVIRAHDADQAREALSKAGLELREPAEDWLFKAYHHDALVDIIYVLGGEPVDEEMLASAEQIEVLAVRMPVLQATDVVASKIACLAEHDCNYSHLLPIVRALREQVNWEYVRRRVDGNPYAEAFLYLTDRLGVTSLPVPEPGTPVPPDRQR